MSLPKLAFEVWREFPFHFGTFSDQRLVPAELPKSDLHPSPVHSAMNMARRSPLRCGQAMLERRLLWIREFPTPASRCGLHYAISRVPLSVYSFDGLRA